MKNKFKLVLLVMVLMLVMVSCKKANPITLPNIDDSQVITVTKIEENKEGPTASITSKKDIVDTIKLIKEKAKPTRKNQTTILQRIQKILEKWKYSTEKTKK